MGIGQKLKETLHSDHSDRKQYNDSSTPGSFPSEHASGRHADGTEYRAPTGTAVGSTGPGMTDRAEDGFTSGHGASGHGTSGHGMGSVDHRVNDRNVMDPADTKHGSNVMNSTGAAGNPLSGSSTGERYEDDHHNKLHKRDDPRRYEGTGPSSGIGAGAGGLASSDIPGRHHAGQDTTGYDRGSTGYGRDTEGYGRDTTGYGGDSTAYGRGTSGSYGQDLNSTSSGDRGHGVYNTITGAGGRDDTSRSHHPGQQGHHDSGDTTRLTGTGSGSREHQGQGTVQHATEMMDPRTTGTGVGTHHGHHEGRHHGGETFDSRNTGTGIGSQDMAYRSHEGTSTGRTSDRHDHIGPSGDSRVLGGSHGGQGLAGAGVGAGAADYAAHEAGRHHGGQQGQYEDAGRSAYDNTGDMSGQRSYNIGNNTTGAPGGSHTSGGMGGMHSSYNDPASTNRSTGQGYDQGYNQGHGMSHGQGHHGGDQDNAVDSIRSQVQRRGVPAGMGSDPGPRQDPPSHLGINNDMTSGSDMAQSGNGSGHGSGYGSGMGSGTSSGGAGSGYHGPGHEGAKVMHTCTHCGRDNDISDYFKKEVVYRLGQ
ncbi:hypothetical protein OHC33_003681 [Knufia fluminis]|uniref:Uncharacterized protein n=1 Tax=Knufia fluminis TaxID=191047 RepID=A0AAN8ENH7_9EURO|nr:hypothetical protein OHC33_003681 [Knufia fluminis]